MAETSASKWAPAVVKFKKLDDLPKGSPNTPADVMKAMKALHAMVHAQAKAYGGKHSKLLPVGIAEAPTFRTYLKLLDEARTRDI
jgi:hypothetical protein